MKEGFKDMAWVCGLAFEKWVVPVTVEREPQKKTELGGKTTLGFR